MTTQQELKLTKSEKEALKELEVVINKYSARSLLQAIYLDFWNNYLSTDVYAEKNLLMKDQAENLLDLAKQVLHTDIDRVL